jgi:hypothetical protein
MYIIKVTSNSHNGEAKDHYFKTMLNNVPIFTTLEKAKRFNNISECEEEFKDIKYLNPEITQISFIKV